jgi:hypothetical protein
MRFNTLLCLLCLTAGTVGCSSTQNRTYSVSVVNAADEPVMLWLTKDGPPFEDHWLTPSQWHELKTDGIIPADVVDPAVLLPPGKRVDLGPQEGKFTPETAAVLLIYATPVTLEQMAATPRDTGLMDILYLDPGQNNLMVRKTLPVSAERVIRLEGRPAAQEQRP